MVVTIVNRMGVMVKEESRLMRYMEIQDMDTPNPHLENHHNNIIKNIKNNSSSSSNFNSNNNISRRQEHRQVVAIREKIHIINNNSNISSMTNNCRSIKTKVSDKARRVLLGIERHTLENRC